MKAETTSSAKIQFNKVERDGRMLGFQDAPQIFLCVEWMGWNMTNPNRGSIRDNTWGDAAGHQAVSSCHHTNALAPSGTEQEGHEHDLVLTSAPASKAELT